MLLLLLKIQKTLLQYTMPWYYFMNSWLYYYRYYFSSTENFLSITCIFSFNQSNFCSYSIWFKILLFYVFWIHLVWLYICWFCSVHPAVGEWTGRWWGSGIVPWTAGPLPHPRGVHSTSLTHHHLASAADASVAAAGNLARTASQHASQEVSASSLSDRNH